MSRTVNITNAKVGDPKRYSSSRGKVTEYWTQAEIDARDQLTEQYGQPKDISEAKAGDVQYVDIENGTVTLWSPQEITRIRKNSGIKESDPNVAPSASSVPNQNANTTGNAANNVDNTTNVPDAPNVQVDATALMNSDEFKTLPADQQEIVKQVYELIATNNQEQAQKLAAAFKTSAAISDPFFKQELRLAVDAIERGFVSIDKEEEFKLEQVRNRKADLEQDLATQRDFLNLEEASALRQIDRQFDQQIKTTRQTLASRGFSSSSRRAETEQLLEESTGDLRESTTRKFGLQRAEIDRTADRSQRDTQSEIERLREITTNNKLDFLRSSEAQVGTDNLNKALPNLNGNVAPLGDIVGDIPRQQTEDIIRGAQNLIF